MSRRAAWSWVAAFVALTAAPYLLARAAAPAGAAYTWVLPPYADDGLAYLAWVKQAALGAWLFRVKFSPAPQPAVIFQPLFLLAGLLSRATGAAPGFALFLLRSAGVALFLLALERFVRRFPLEKRARALALAFAALSSGLGWIAAWGPFKPAAYPADLWLVDIGTLWSLVWNPLYPFALALMLAIADVWLDERAAGRDRRLLAAGALASLLALLHPYDAAIVVLAAAATCLLRRRDARAFLLFAAAAAPGALYQLWASGRNPVLGAHTEAGLMASPTPLGLLWGLGLPGLLAIAGAALVVRRRKTAAFAPALGWAAAALSAAYAPVWFQRKLLFGVQLPLAVLAAVGADALLARLTARAGRRASAAYAAFAVLLVAPTLPTHAVNALRTAASLRSAGERGPYYVGAELGSALAALAARGRPDEPVAAAPDLSLLIPGLAGNSVFAGHWAQAAGAEAAGESLDEALAPASGLSPAQRLAALRGEGARFVLFDDSLKALAGGAVPSWLAAASERVFASPRYELYRLSDAADGAPSRR